MDSKEIIRLGLTEYWDGLRKALSGLTAAERRFQPYAHANHIDFIVWHMARDEDGEVHAFAQRTSPIWQREAWYQKLGLPPEDDGFGYTVEQVAALPQFAIADCLAYYEAVRRATLRYLDGLTLADWERCPDPARHPGSTIGRMLSHLIVEGSQHLGQVAYLRGAAARAGISDLLGQSPYPLALSPVTRESDARDCAVSGPPSPA